MRKVNEREKAKSNEYLKAFTAALASKVLGTGPFANKRLIE